jgi:NAD(P)-dependent dehydrogenase (short-subunit alcohol dehydrogenase family)/acyl carrier protein
VAETLLATVAATTGYPREILNLPMELEADLGVDSIKRVEILSNLRARLPDLPDLPMGEIGPLRTLGEIVDLIHCKLSPVESPSSTLPTTPVVQTRPPGSSAPPPAADPAAGGVAEILLATVSEKTGYPRDVLGLHMELEADLGVDSIKRVEILSALRGSVPDLPSLELQHLAPLKTLGEVVAWIENRLAPATPAGPRSEAGETSSVRRIVCGVREKAVLGFSAPGLQSGGLIGITDDGTGIAHALSSELEGAGLQAVVLAPGRPEEGLTGLILLEGLRSFRGPEEATGCHRSAFQSLRRWGPAVAGAGGLIVTVQDTGGSFGIEQPAHGLRPWAGGLSALARTAAAEWPALTARAVDSEVGGRAPAEVARVLARELLCGGREPEVGLSATGRRIVPVPIETAVSPGVPWLTEGDVVLAVGGARGVTGSCLEELARRCKLRFALLGRTRPEEFRSGAPEGDESAIVNALLAQARMRGEMLLPPAARTRAREILASREVLTTLERLRQLGSEVIYQTADAVDPEAVARAVEEVRRRWGPPQVVVYGAGVLADKLIAEKTDEQFDRVFGVKVRGLGNVLSATAGDPLRGLVLFSSMAARTGNPGQCDYAAANEVLNQVARAEARRREGRCVVKSFCWGPWDGGMVTPSLGQHFRERGVQLLCIEAGARFFADELTSRGGDVVVMAGSALSVPVADRSEKDREWRFMLPAGTLPGPGLRDHAVRGVPVVPAALVVEWFARAVGEAFPGRRLAEMEQFRVLCGVPLPDDRSGVPDLEVRLAPEGAPDGVRLELRDLTGRSRYSALGRLAGETEVIQAPALAPLPASGPWPFEPAGIYDGPLFHGPGFHTIVGLDSMSPQGGSGRLVGTAELGWEGGPYVTDPAALDGCLQLPMLWGGHHLGRQSLPAFIERLVLCSSGGHKGELTCRFRAGHHRDGLSADVLLSDAGGRPALFIGGLQMYALAIAEEAPVT